ncbi:MAG: catalase, partial [Actinomycetota bacterium]|nr:catalase [Actinomycetota bacterium]
MTTPRDVPGLGHESAPLGEETALARVVELSREKFEHDYANVRPVLRDQHPKSHGCVRAEFVVGPDVPGDLRHGIFAEPRTYAAWIRFSSSSSQPRPDSKRDAHGMAIKVIGVEGEKVLPFERDETTQDFVVANSRVFFCRNASDYVVLASRMSEGKFLRFFFGADPRKWRVREFVNMMIATQKKVLNPLQIRYWSQTPSALGPQAVKYSAKPHGGRAETKAVNAGSNHLEEAIARQLESGEASFDFMVQLQTDP